MNFATFLRTPFSQNTSRRPLPFFMHWFVFFPEKQHTKVEAFMDLIPETDLNLKTRNQVKKFFIFLS